MDTDFLLEVVQGDMEEPFLVHSNGEHTYVYPHDGISYSPCEDLYKLADQFKAWLRNVNVVPTLNVLQLLNFFTFLGFFIYYVIAPKSIETIYVPASFGCVLVQMSITLIKEWVLIEG
jgi:hypothetical protein